MANLELELQSTIVARLKADPTVTALIAGRVYDSVPQGATFPYVTIGPVDAVSFDPDCITGFDVAQQIDCWSRAVGSPEVKKIVDAVRAALHDQEAAMPLSTNAMAFFEHRNTRITRDPDGLTSHGILGFEAAIERLDSAGPGPTPIVITSLSPNTAFIDTLFTLSVFGSGFLATDKIVFGGTEYAVTLVSSGRVNSAVQIPAGAIPATIQVRVKRGDGSLQSNQLAFTVTEVPVETSVEFRSIANTTYTSRSSTIVNKPAGTVAGDILIAIIAGVASGSGLVAITPPADWTQIGTATERGPYSGFYARFYAFWKRAGSSEPTDYTFAQSNTHNTQGVISAYSGGAAAGDPIDAFSSNSGTGSATTATGISTTTPGGMLIFAAHDWQASGTLTPPAGMMERLDSLIYLADQTVSAGATGNRTMTNGNVGGSDPWAAALIGIKSN
jgi:hypothetical protein